MYKLIIADDEKMIRDSLSKLVNWNELGFELVETFGDGQEVIEYLEYIPVDVVLTDIKMTHVSGMDVAKYVYAEELDCQVVFISGYQEFDLAVQGIKYGVNDYLLKPTNVKIVKETFLKIKDILDAKEKKQETELTNKKRFDEMVPLLREHFLSDLVLGVFESKETVDNRMKLLYPQIDVNKSTCILADIIIKDYDTFMNTVWKYNFDQFEINMSNFVKLFSETLSLNIVYKSGEQVELFGILTTESETPEKDCIDEFMKFIYEISEVFGLEVKSEIKGVFTSIYDVIGYKEKITVDGLHSNIQYLKEQKKLMMSNISSKNIVAARNIFDSILHELRDIEKVQRNNFVIEIFDVIGEVIKNSFPTTHEKIHGYVDYNVLASLSNIEELKSYCDRAFDRLKLWAGSVKEYDNDSLIYKAKQYIAQNITKDISQEETANVLYICSAYLSRIFKKQTGENFTQYVTRVKMDKAIELLKDPQYKTYQVSGCLGYKTPRYFSKLFKMYTGLNPSQYRSSVLKIGVGVINDEEYKS